MNKIIKYLFFFFFFFIVNKSYSQEKKIAKVQKLILIQDFKAANDLILKIIDKNPDFSCAIYYSALVDFKLGKSIDTILNKLDACDIYFKSISRDQYLSDSITYNYSKIRIDTFRIELSNFAFNQYYKFSNTIDSLDLFKKKFKTSESQNYYINDRICQIAVEKILNSTDREAIINFITNYKECGQINMVKLQLEQVEWHIAKNINTILSYSLFASDHPNSKYSDSVGEKIEIITWQEVLTKDSLLVYLDYINTHPNSTFFVLAKKLHDKLLWEKRNIKVDIINMQKYIDECIECEFKNKALENIANLEWNLIIDTKDTSVLNDFLIKRPNFSKIDLVKSQKLKIKNDILKSKTNIGLGTKSFDIWKQKLALYDKSKTQYLRTKVFFNGHVGVSDRINKNNILRLCMSVDEVFMRDHNDIMYSVTDGDEEDSYYKRKLVTNYDGIIGLEVSNIYIAQQFSENYFSLSTGDYLFNFKSGDHDFLRMPKYDFTFNKLKPFPYLRVGCPDYLFSSSYSNRGNRNYRPHYYNSDLIYSIENEKLSCLIKSGSRYNILFGSGKRYFNLDNELYDVANLSKLQLNFDRLIDGNPNGLNGVGGHTFERIPAPIVTFNDSLCISYYKKAKILKIYNFGTEKVDTIQLDFYRDMMDDANFEVDQFGKYLYIEFRPKDENGNEYTSGYSSNNADAPNCLKIYDCKTKKLVYLGPSIRIDHTMEKIGWVMTKAISIQKENVKISPKKLEQVEMYGLDWELTNYQPPIGKYESVPSSPVFVLERSLINLSGLLNIDFQKDLENKIANLTPVEDIFNVNYVANRKQFLFDSLITCSHLWSQGSVIDWPNIPINVDQNVPDSLFIKHVEKYSSDLPHPQDEYSEFIPRLLSLKRNGDLFTFSFCIDSLPINLLELNANFPGDDPNPFDKIVEYYDDFQINGNHGGNLKRLKDSTIKLIDSNFFSYKFEIITNEEKIAQQINKNIKDKIFSGQLSRTWNSSSIMNSLEVQLIDEYFESSNLDVKHYWMDVLEQNKNNGIGVWEVSLDLVFLNQENWKFPALLHTPTQLTFRGIY